MPPNPKSPADKERGKRLEKWLERVAPEVKPSYRGSVVLEQPRMTVVNWINGSQISNVGICKIIEVGGYEALGYILGTKPHISSAKISQSSDMPLVHGKGTRFWYNQYVREKARTILDEKQDYTEFPKHSREAIRNADEYARITASKARSSGIKKPRIKDHDFS
ncbi:MAG: hypothetical protein LIQ31_13635 [Planctomycetes bacterium]|nr:hypothetical protein [Planctomycetota bacterium]